MLLVKHKFNDWTLQANIIEYDSKTNVIYSFYDYIQILFSVLIQLCYVICMYALVIMLYSLNKIVIRTIIWYFVSYEYKTTHYNIEILESYKQ